MDAPTHWTDTVPTTVEEVDEGARNLCGQMMAGSLVNEYLKIMGRLYDLRCMIQMFSTKNTESFAKIFASVRSDKPAKPTRAFDVHEITDRDMSASVDLDWPVVIVDLLNHEAFSLNAVNGKITVLHTAPIQGKLCRIAVPILSLPLTHLDAISALESLADKPLHDVRIWRLSPTRYGVVGYGDRTADNADTYLRQS